MVWIGERDKRSRSLSGYLRRSRAAVGCSLSDAHVCHTVFLALGYAEIQWSLAEIFRVIPLSFEHDKLYRLRVGDVSQRVGRQHDKVRYCSGFDGAE